MRYSKVIFVAVLSALGVQVAGAAPTPEEAAELGKSLTPLGAIKAGNKEGTIPEWTGGVCTPPAGYAPIKGAAGGAPYIDPFAADKPLYTIKAADVPKYADKLDEGTKELFRRYPQSFAVEVYPTRRSACFPSYVYENTVKNVMKPKIVWGGAVPGVEGAHAQTPFPIPKSGVEAMWNAALKPEQPYTMMPIDTFLVDAAGNEVNTSLQTIYNQNLYWDTSRTALTDDEPYWALISKSIAPASQVGTMQMRHQFLRPDIKGAPAWSYIPGQRRVRLAPEFSYDGVAITSGGILLYDEINGFDGKMDKFDFKLVGRKEMYIPYNTYKFWSAPNAELHGPKHIHPSALRFELHRVWVVEATLKPGERHVHSKRIFLIDEDSWNMMEFTAFDQAGKVHHIMYQPSIQMYDKPELRNTVYVLYDLAKSSYLNQNRQAIHGDPKYTSSYKVAPFAKNFFTPDSMAGMGLR
ncbi:MAG: DUF1329 domain-containing protein [Rhodocyclaceae bacterium]|jgi:hypothetical protein|nr:DUF1329 domain-containing protein [Rhodocyclaceae bacterium]